jgi:hypothetical protein
MLDGQYSLQKSLSSLFAKLTTIGEWLLANYFKDAVSN